MQRNSVKFTLIFATIVCVCCSVLVATSAVVLADRQESNRKIYKQRNVLLAAGIIKDGQDVSNNEVSELFTDAIEVRLVDLETGDYVEDANAADYNQLAARDDPAQSEVAPANSSSIKRVPHKGMVFLVKQDGALNAFVIPIEGYGLWGTLYGYLALEKDGTTIRGITYYEHKETPGLGGEVDNPKWKALWPGRTAIDDQGQPVIRVIKGPAGDVDEDPRHIDGLSGATITSNGITYMMDFWLGENGYGPFIQKFREQGGAVS
ncbi:MAG: Na(+)-translocating NADH-quinone reductase subunit C [Candidatus Hydrogenedentes bacterium]|nr:Na(+)-translocating NADH-quinone reductase subunit C [Candidatus Hydrogenedentota bacterium]